VMNYPISKMTFKYFPLFRFENDEWSLGARTIRLPVNFFRQIHQLTFFIEEKPLDGATGHVSFRRLVKGLIEIWSTW
jgi:hypothetical protein